MHVYTGIDAIEIERIGKSIEKDSFLRRILGDEEYEYYKSKNFHPESVAGAFCAKEAFSKAIGTGIRDFALSEVQVIHNELGKPSYKFSGDAARIVNERNLEFDLSIAHTGSTAYAVAVATEREKN